MLSALALGFTANAAPLLLDGTWTARDLQVGHFGEDEVTCALQEVSLVEGENGKLTGCTRYQSGCEGGLPWNYTPLAGMRDRKTGSVMLYEVANPKDTWYQGSVAKTGKLDLMIQRHLYCFWHFIEPQAGRSSAWNMCGEGTPFTSPPDEDEQHTDEEGPTMDEDEQHTDEEGPTMLGKYERGDYFLA